MTIVELNHPVALHKISILRDKKTKSVQFRQLVNELTLLLAVRATASLDLTETKQLESPLGPYQGVKLRDHIGISSR